MAQHLDESLWLDGRIDFSRDPLLEAAYVVSEWVITFVGPIFWISLVYLFVIAELGR